MRIALLGDIALFGRCTTIDYFKEIGEYLSTFDYVVGNLETPFSAKKKTNGAKSAYICADPSSLVLLKVLHLNAVTLANNHMFDYGKEGYELTKSLLRENGIEWFGAEGKELFVEMVGNRIAFSGFCCYSSNPLKCVRSGEYGVNAYDLETVEMCLKKNDENGFLNIVAVHAGIEHVNYPSLDHVKAARKLADLCPYIYYGHHPHVIQGIEEYKGSLIAHSLGNFCFDDVYADASVEKPLVELTEDNRTGMVLELSIENNQITEWKEQVLYIPTKGRLSLVKQYDKLNDYNSILKNCKEKSIEYEDNRSRLINQRIAERKSKRDINWYLKRLRPRYVQLMLDMRRNNKHYNESVKRYL